MTDTTYESILDLRIGGWDYDPGERSIEDRIADHLDFIGEVELSEPRYSFDTIRLYRRKSDGMLLFAHDAGCSCPAPFGDYRVADLIETNPKTFADVVIREYGCDSEAIIRRDLNELVAKAVSLNG